MTTALQILNRAAEITGYKDPSEPLSGDDASQFLSVLNGLVDSWNTSRLFIVASSEVSASVSASPVSVGPSQTLDTARPVRIESGFIRDGEIDYPLEWITAQEYDAIEDKSATSTVPLKAFYSPGVPYGSVYLWPAPSGSVDLHVRVMAQLSEFADTATEYDLAPGYKRALEYSTAEEIHPSRITPKIAQMAASARRAIKKTNHEPLQLESSDVTSPGTFNVYIGR